MEMKITSILTENLAELLINAVIIGEIFRTVFYEEFGRWASRYVRNPHVQISLPSPFEQDRFVTILYPTDFIDYVKVFGSLHFCLRSVMRHQSFNISH